MQGSFYTSIGCLQADLQDICVDIEMNTLAMCRVIVRVQNGVLPLSQLSVERSCVSCYHACFSLPLLIAPSGTRLFAAPTVSVHNYSEQKCDKNEKYPKACGRPSLRLLLHLV